MEELGILLRLLLARTPDLARSFDSNVSHILFGSSTCTTSGVELLRPVLMGLVSISSTTVGSVSTKGSGVLLSHASTAGTRGVSRSVVCGFAKTFPESPNTWRKM